MKIFSLILVFFIMLNGLCFGTQDLVRQLTNAEQAIKSQKYSTAIYNLTNLINSLKERQKREIQKYFPASFEEFQSESQPYQYGELMSNTEQVGALFSRHYRDKDDHSIDINLVFLDPAIEEYINIIKNPKLIENMEHTSIIKINDTFNSLEKFIRDELYCERNIIITDKALLNIIINGINDKSVIDNFCTAIDLTGLKNYISE